MNVTNIMAKICFVFQFLQPSSRHRKSTADSDTLESPSDIYSRFSPCFGPRSILKGKTEHKKHRQKNKSERKVAFETDSCFRNANTSDRKARVHSEGRDKHAVGESAMKQVSCLKFPILFYCLA